MASSKFESLVGLLYDRTLGQRDVDYPHLQRLQRHLRQLGKRVPIIEINMVSAKSLHKWDSSRMAPLNLRPSHHMGCGWFGEKMMTNRTDASSRYRGHLKDG